MRVYPDAHLHDTVLAGLQYTTSFVHSCLTASLISTICLYFDCQTLFHLGKLYVGLFVCWCVCFKLCI